MGLFKKEWTKDSITREINSLYAESLRIVPNPDKCLSFFEKRKLKSILAKAMELAEYMDKHQELVQQVDKATRKRLAVLITISVIDQSLKE